MPKPVPRGVAYDGVGRPLGNMGVALGDTRNVGVFDLFVTHLPEEGNTLWHQGPCGTFIDRTAAVGLARVGWRATGFGAVFADFNHDGNLDAAVVNGRVFRAPGAERSASKGGAFWDAYAERNQLFIGTGDGRFRDASADEPTLCGTPNVARALAVGDVNNDGAPDLLYTCVGGRARLLRNVAPERGHWLVVRALDPALKRDAYGAEVAVEAGGWRRVGWVNPGQSYLSSHDPRVHFGLGQAPEVTGITVRWPDGTRERFPGGPADRSLTIRKGKGTALPPEPGKS